MSKKRLGQFMTGMPLGRLLAALAEADKAESVIDPMVGTGDMISGCIDLGADPKFIGGIEIDPTAHAICLDRMTSLERDGATVVLGDAFAPTNLMKLPRLSWDLVITNPPYVRYQSGSQSLDGNVFLPTALEVRRGLIAALEILPALDSTDRQLFQHLAEGYSGLADLAVPSWILSAALVNPGGTLAMVVPQAWLTRNYAHTIQYLLARWFDVQYLVEDEHAAWFSNALVRTSLVVAKRRKRKSSALDGDPRSGYLRVRLLSKDAADERSVVGSIYPSDENPDVSFARDLACWRQLRRQVRQDSIAAEWVPSSYTSSVIQSVARNQRWFRMVEPVAVKRSSDNLSVHLPLELRDILEDRAVEWASFEDLGWQAGQGLRTGANAFFYAECIDENQKTATLATSALLGAEAIEVPKDAVMPVLHRQTNLPNDLRVRASDLSGRVFVLDRYALPEDIEASIRAGAKGSAMQAFRMLPNEIAEYVRRASNVSMGGDGSRKIPSLSAVITNVRQVDSKSRALPRFWYQLPPLADRHRPDLALARVNYGHPSTYLNLDRAGIIDANFSTLWKTPSAIVSEHALVAVLNSAWCAATLELTGTVLGGGALKVEATHLRRLPLPKGTRAIWEQLSALGLDLIRARPERAPSVMDRIDRAVMRALVGTSGAEHILRAIKRLGAERLKMRAR